MTTSFISYLKMFLNRIYVPCVLLLLIPIAAVSGNAQLPLAADRPATNPSLEGVFDKAYSKGESPGTYYQPNLFPTAVPARPAPAKEPFHWKGLVLQSLAFDGIENGVRIAAADASDRKILVNKPFWHDYVASLKQFNMGRWNDGDSFTVNYIGHPLQGAITGYLEVQNNPHDRSVRFGNNDAYIHSRLRAFGWSTVYSTGWELLPIGEAGIFNQGGYTYPIRCKGAACKSPTATYTNNTGWVDFVITPVLGTGLIVLEDYFDTLTDRALNNHPNAARYKILRASANPSRSVANVLRGRYPWFRDYDRPEEWESPIAPNFERALNEEPNEHIDIFAHYTGLSLRTNRSDCFGCRQTVSGPGIGVGIRLRRYLDLVIDVSHFANASPLSSPNIGGNLTTFNVGLRSGFNGRLFAVKFAISPGLATYSHAQAVSTSAIQDPRPSRVTNFQGMSSISGDLKLNSRLAFRATVEHRLIRYKSPVNDPPGIGTPPNLSFLSHDYFLNSTNWGVRVGPVLRF